MWNILHTFANLLKYFITSKFKKMLKRWLSGIYVGILLIFAFSSQTAFARKFYVSNSGSDANSFSAAQNSSTPWATLSKVSSSMSSFTSGDSILFAKGSKFSGSIVIQSKTGLFFGTYGSGAKPLFWGTGSTISALFRVRTCTSMVFRGLSVSDTTISSTDRTVQAKIQNVFVIEASSTGVTVKDITMDRIGYGVYMTRTSPGQTVDSCDIGNLRMIRNTPTSVNPDDDYGGVPVQVSGRNNTITNNYFHDCWSISYDYGYDGGGIEFFEEGDTIMNNIIAYNTFYDNNGTFEHGSSSDGVANNPIMNNKFYYNKIINSSSLFYINNNGQYKTAVRNSQFYNNVIIQTVASRTGNLRLGSMAVNDTTSGIIVLKNNIFQVSNGAAVMRSGQFTGSNLTHTNNIYKLSNGSVTNFTLDGTEIATSGVIWVNSSDVNPLNWDYNLISTSPAINAGVAISGLTRDFNNQVVSDPPDIGILEFAGATPPGAPTVTVVSPTSGTFGQVVTLTGTNFVNVNSVVFVTGVTVPLSFTVVSTTSIRVTMNLQSSQYVNAPNGGIFVVTTATGSNTGGSPYFVYTPPPAPQCSFIYGNWSECLGNIQTRQYITSPAGCAGTPPFDSVSRACVTPVVSNFYFDDTSAILNLSCNTSGSLQILNSTGQIVITFDYSSGNISFDVSTLAPGNYTATTFGSSLAFSTFVGLKIESTTGPLCRRSTDGSINVYGVLGVGPYTYSKNSTTNYSNTTGIFSNLTRGTYVIRVKDSTGRVASLSITLVKRSSTCFILKVNSLEYCMN